jgi:chromosome segregation ATPase
MAFETVRGRLEAALQEKVLTDGRMKSLGKLESKVITAEYAAAQIKMEIASAIHELNTAIEFDLGRIADRERERQILWDKEIERMKAERDRELIERLALKEQLDTAFGEIAGIVREKQQWHEERTTLEQEIVRLKDQDERTKEQTAALELQLGNTKALMVKELEALRGQKSHLSSELEREKKGHNETKRAFAELQHSHEAEQIRAKANLDRAEKAEASGRALREELAVLKAMRSATPSESDASVMSEQFSHRSRASSKDARKGDKTDRTDKSDRSDRRRARRDKDAALEEAERLRGELATFKTCYSNLQKELQVVSGDLALLDTREEAVREEVEKKEDEVRRAHLEIEALEDQLYSLQALREEDQREEKWVSQVHSGSFVNVSVCSLRAHAR